MDSLVPYWDSDKGVKFGALSCKLSMFLKTILIFSENQSNSLCLFMFISSSTFWALNVFLSLIFSTFGSGHVVTGWSDLFTVCNISLWSWNEVSSRDIHTLNIDCKLSNNQQIISNTFNDHFLSTADRINNKTTNNLNFGKHSKYPMEYLLQIFKSPFPNIQCNYTSSKGTENIKS